MGVLSDEDLVAMRTRARHRLIGALGLVLLLIVGVPLLIDRHEPSPGVPSDEASAAHNGAADAPSPQPSTVSPLGVPADTPTAVGVPGNAAAGFDAAHPPASPSEADRHGEVMADSKAAAEPPAGQDAPAAPAGQTVIDGLAHPQAVPATIPPIDTHPPARHAGKAGEVSTKGEPVKQTVARDEQGAGKNDKAAARDDKGAGKSDKSAARDDKGTGKNDQSAARDDKTARKDDKATVKDDKAAGKPDRAAGKDDKAAGKASEAAAADDKAAAAKDAKPATVHGWLVQFGMFAVAENAETLTKRLESKGIQAHHEPYVSSRGAYTRVRAGPFPTRAAADEVLARARALGENANLVHQ